MVHSFVFCCLCFWHLVGVFADSGAVKSVSVTEKKTVTLESGLTEIKTNHVITWKFEQTETPIAQINKAAGKFDTYDGPDGRFRDRLKLDHQTGSLTITDTRTTDSGLYEVSIRSETVTTNRFNVTVYGVFADSGAVKSVSVTEKNPVTLQSGLTEIKTNHVITWKSGQTETIAYINKEATIFNTYNGPDERFRDRLKLDHQTGSLTITDTRTTDSGLYQITINDRTPTTYRFNVTVYARLSVPVISSNSSQCSSSSSSSSCSLVCSVVNVSRVTLSWYKGNSLLSSISVSDLSSSVSLHLEVEYQDKNTYSCVLNNPISNQALHLDIPQLCHTCAEARVHCCDTVEAVIRLVVTALMGVAAAAAAVLLINDIRSTRGEKKKTEQI